MLPISANPVATVGASPPMPARTPLGEAIPIRPVLWTHNTYQPISLFKLTMPSREHQGRDHVVGLGCGYTDADAIERFWRLYIPHQVRQDPDALLNHLQQLMQSQPLCRVTHWDYQQSEYPALSAIAMAAYDAKAKLAGVPLHQLLGEQQRDKVKAYGSVIIESVQSLESVIASLKETGFKAIKLTFPHFGHQPPGMSVEAWYQAEEAVIKRARDAAGPDTLLMLDAYASDPAWTAGYDYAHHTAEMLHRYQFLWYEDPLPPDQVHLYQTLTADTAIQISGGERLVGAAPFERWMEQQAVNIIQPDQTVAGGPLVLKQLHDGLQRRSNESRHESRHENPHQLSIIPHGWNSAIGLACDLHFLSVQPKEALCLVEYMPGYHNDQLALPPFELDSEGCLAVPEGVGLGVRINEENL